MQVPSQLTNQFSPRDGTRRRQPQGRSSRSASETGEACTSRSGFRDVPNKYHKIKGTTVSPDSAVLSGVRPLRCAAGTDPGRELFSVNRHLSLTIDFSQFILIHERNPEKCQDLQELSANRDIYISIPEATASRSYLKIGVIIYII